jgi:putative tryptophan/tyrosine transport system substrate-binding protein
MRRRSFIAGAAASAAVHLTASAQSARGPFRIGYIGAGNPSESAFTQFVGGLRQVGWIDGRDYVLKSRFANADLSQLSALLDQLLRDGIDVLVVTGAPTRLVPQAERAVPVVFSYSGDPVAAGFVRSLARPGGNATGNSQMMWELTGKRLELLREIAPEARRTLVVQSPDHPGETEERSLTLKAGQRLGFEIVMRPVVDRASLQAALASPEAATCDSLLCFTDAVTIVNRALIAEHALRMRIPSVFPRREFCEAGGLASYGPSIASLIGQLAGVVKRIAAGVPAGELPVEWPAVIETVANLQTAKAIGRTLPDSLMIRADQVIG